MIARELAEFFAGFSPDGGPAVQRARRPHLPLQRQRLLRARLLGADPLPRRPLLRGPGLRRGHARRRLEQGLPPRRRRAARPRLPPGRVHAPLLRRVPRPARGEGPRRAVRARGSAGHVRRAVGADRRWMREQGMGGGERRAGRRARPSTTRDARSSRRSARARSDCRRRCAAPLAGGPRRRRRPASRPQEQARAGAARPRRCPRASGSRRCSLPRTTRSPRGSGRNGPAPLLDPVPGMAERERLRLAMVIPPFTRGSGGHNTLLQIFTRLERRGHACSVWLADYSRLPQRGLAGGAAPARSASSSRPSRGRSTRASALAGRRRRDRDRLAHGPRDAGARRLPRPRLRRQRPRARVLRLLGRARAERRHLPPTACTASRPARGCATC